MRIASGVTDQYIYFVAVDSTDFTTRETGLSSFTVYRSRNGAAAAAMTTPTINETDSTNMPGVYELLLDEDMTIGSGNDTEEMVFHITKTGMAPVTRTIELFRPKITAGNTLDVTATGAAGIDWGNVENPTTTVDLSATSINLCDTVTTLTGHTAQTGDSYARLGAPAGASVSADIATVDGNVDAVLVDTGTTIPATLTTIDGNVDSILVDTGTTIPAQITALNDPTAGAIADAVWDEAIAGHVGAGSTGEALSNATAPTASEVADAVWDEATSGHTTAGTFGEQVKTDIDAILVDTATTIPGTLTTIEGKVDTVDTNVDAVLVDTGTTLPSQITALNDLDAAGVRSAVGLASANLDTQLTTIDTVADGIQTDLDNATDGLGAIKTAVDAIPTSNPTASDIAFEVWEEPIATHSASGGNVAEALADIPGNVWDVAIAAHLDSGSTGEALNAAGASGDPWTTTLPGSYTGSQAGKVLSDVLTDTGTDIPASISALNDVSAADVNAQVDIALSDYDAPTKAEMDSGFAALNDPSVAAIADAVWDEPIADHLTSGGATADSLNDASAGGGLDAAGVRAAVGLASANLDTQLGTIDTNVDEILTDTGTTIPATLTTIEGKVDTVDSNVDLILVDTDTTIPGLIASLNDLDAAGVRTAVGMAAADLDTQLAALPTATENADALLNRDMSAVSDTNARSPLNALRFLRNKWSVTGTTLTVTKEDDSTSAWTAALTADAAANPVVGSDPA